jgi:hypothetical protein
MATQRQFVISSIVGIGDTPELAPLSPSRVLVIGGVSLIVAGMIFGDIFAVFVLHQNAGRELGRGVGSQ